MIRKAAEMRNLASARLASRVDPALRFEHTFGHCIRGGHLPTSTKIVPRGQTPNAPDLTGNKLPVARLLSSSHIHQNSTARANPEPIQRTGNKLPVARLQSSFHVHQNDTVRPGPEPIQCTGNKLPVARSHSRR